MFRPRISAEGRQCPRLIHVTTIAFSQRVFLRGQNAFLAAGGFEIHAVASPGPDLEYVRTRDDVVTHAVSISRTVTPLRDCLTIVRLYLLFRQLRPHIAHLSTPKAALLGSIAAWFARVPIRIFFVRGSITESATGVRRTLYRLLEGLTARLCTDTVCVSPSLLRFAVDQGIVSPSARVLAAGMSNGLDRTRFNAGVASPAATEGTGGDTKPSDSVPIIGFVGRLARDKGIEELAAAWDIVKLEFPDCRLLLVGSWEAEDAVRQTCRARLEHDERVELPGAVDDPLPYYRRMSVFAYPSHGSEGWPNAPMEAAAVGIPVVATRVVGCVDAVVDGSTGALVEKGDIGALAAALRTYLLDASLRQRHGAEGRKRALGDFAQETIWAATRDFYVSLLEREGLPVPESAESQVGRVDATEAVPDVAPAYGGRRGSTVACRVEQAGE